MLQGAVSTCSYSVLTIENTYRTTTNSRTGTIQTGWPDGLSVGCVVKVNCACFGGFALGVSFLGNAQTCVRAMRVNTMWGFDTAKEQM